MLREAFSSKEDWVWDPSFVDDEAGAHHTFLLRASRSHDQLAQHDYARIGRAVTSDYLVYKDKGLALELGEPDSWDDYAHWTGSVIKSKETGLWHMFYTGRGSADPVAQYIGHAVSENLEVWQKITVDAPLIVPAHPYSTHTGRDKRFPAFRDPFVYRDEKDGIYRMLITARSNDTDPPYNGCFATARSYDLEYWELGEPLMDFGNYVEMEVPQRVIHDGQLYIFFHTRAGHYSPEWEHDAEGKFEGLHAFWAESADGELKPVNGNGVVLANGKELYDTRLVERQPGTDDYLSVGFLDRDDRGNYVGAISAPFLLRIQNGEVTLV